MVKVQVERNGRVEWVTGEIIGRSPAPRSFLERGKGTAWYTIRTLDGTVYEMCNPACVRCF